jgi:tRNA nucleotidyltransferase (CCA-adding enzyme)
MDPVDDEQRLIEKLRRIEALFARPGTDGERTAAASAAERLRARLRETAQVDPPVEYQFSMPDAWSRRLFMALLRRYSVEPYRYRSQRRTTVMARVSRRFVDEILWPQFDELNRTLRTHLGQVTERVVAEAVCADSREEDVRPDASDKTARLASQTARPEE